MSSGPHIATHPTFGPGQFVMRQHDHQPDRTAAGIFGGADDVVVRRGFQFLFMEGRGIERIVQTQDAIEAQFDCDGVDLVCSGIHCHG